MIKLNISKAGMHKFSSRSIEVFEEGIVKKLVRISRNFVIPKKNLH
jgi:hypothetical protein